jgi:hypothetical protein
MQSRIEIYRFLVPAGLVLGLLAFALNAWGEIPTELKTAVNHLSFLAAVARRCDTAPELRGKAGLQTKACRDFHAKVHPVLNALRAQDDLMRKTAREIDTTTSWTLKLEGHFFMRQFQADWDSISRTMDHMQFYWQ